MTMAAAFLSNFQENVMDSLETICNNVISGTSVDHYLTAPSGASNDVEHVIFFNFSDIFMKLSTSKDNAETIVTDYIDYIMNSPNLSSRNRINLQLSFLVCWHSYIYWHNQHKSYTNLEL
jgi:hypothetical protein